MTPDKLARLWQERWLPILGTAAFLVLIVIAEHQVRTSPQWPPPARHEVGAWEVPDPPAFTLAGGLNLPASVLIVASATASDFFTYAMDDHELIVYIPWTIFVWYLWRFIAWHIELRSGTWIEIPSRRRLLLFLGQLVVTAELIYCAVGLSLESPPEYKPTPTIVLLFLWIWSAVALLGWANLIIAIKQKRSDTNVRPT